MLQYAIVSVAQTSAKTIVKLSKLKYLSYKSQGVKTSSL